MSTLFHNKLSQAFASSSLAIAVATLASLAGSVFVAPSANATTVKWSDFILGTSIENGDKIVKYVSSTSTTPGTPPTPFVAEGDDTVSLNFFGDEYFFVYDASPGLSSSNPNSGSFTYTIEITDPHAVFSGVSLDSTVTSTYGTVTKTVAETGLLLTSTSGSPDPAFGFSPLTPIYKKLTITDTFAPNSGEALISSFNGFKQTPVPEPSDILSLLALGGLGLVSLKRKHS